MNILCAYNANIDSICHIDSQELSRMLSDQTGTEVKEKLANPPGSISSKSDFLTGLVLCMRDGTGAEWLIHERDVFEWLRQTFLNDSFMRMGGNMGIMANVLSELGASKVIPNVASLSKLQASFFSHKAIFHPYNGRLYSSKEIASVLPVDASRPELIHFVFDFKKGDMITLLGESILVPRENRFIATYDPLNFQIYIDEHFRDYSLKHAGEMDGAIVSGFHMLQESEEGPGKSDYKNRLDMTLGQLQSWKNVRKGLHIHVEFGHFSSAKIATYAFSILAPIVDRIGMNEDELAMLAQVNGIDPKPILSMDSVAIAESSIKLCSDFGLCRMLVHTREFVISVSCRKEDDPEKMIAVMNFGASCAAAFACSGKLGDRQTMLAIASNIRESEYGKAESSRLAKRIDHECKCSAVCGIHMSYLVAIVPTRICDEPVSTVGLGDTISAAIFLRELELNS
ncbi:ADP-dependent glucokinase/phosphofructokinase [Methanolobus psychrotolerans]|uniref:ADP-dependent glucokinase/phosphofructokinase n=1 Tax=Methanolobus psychrotolerans TaxID=1874706 RepID=UPI000B919D6A|nr:ADP-dependent glucokinase/phosphofructokinase [Methanolobus psychrotolerans]